VLVGVRPARHHARLVEDPAARGFRPEGRDQVEHGRLRGGENVFVPQQGAVVGQLEAQLQVARELRGPQLHHGTVLLGHVLQAGGLLELELGRPPRPHKVPEGLVVGPPAAVVRALLHRHDPRVPEWGRACVSGKARTQRTGFVLFRFFVRATGQFGRCTYGSFTSTTKRVLLATLGGTARYSSGVTRECFQNGDDAAGTSPPGATLFSSMVCSQFVPEFRSPTTKYLREARRVRDDYW